MNINMERLQCHTTDICGVQNIGCFGHCEDIVLPYVAVYTDLYTIEFKRNGHYGIFDIVGVEGQNLVIPAGMLNESADIHLTVRHKYDAVSGILPQEYFLKTIIKIDNNELYTN